jgi:hypothetical protein
MDTPTPEQTQPKPKSAPKSLSNLGQMKTSKISKDDEKAVVILRSFTNLCTGRVFESINELAWMDHSCNAMFDYILEESDWIVARFDLMLLHVKNMLIYFDIKEHTEDLLMDLKWKRKSRFVPKNRREYENIKTGFVLEKLRSGLGSMKSDVVTIRKELVNILGEDKNKNMFVKVVFRFMDHIGVKRRHFAVNLKKEFLEFDKKLNVCTEFLCRLRISKLNVDIGRPVKKRKNALSKFKRGVMKKFKKFSKGGVKKKTGKKGSGVGGMRIDKDRQNKIKEALDSKVKNELN